MCRIITDFEQGSEAWHLQRAGKPTASCFGKLYTGTGRTSIQRAGYIDDLLAERLLGTPLDSYSNHWMDRGTKLEPEARAYYEFAKDTDVLVPGFVETDDGLIGCSPDGLVGGDGGVEIKCPSPGVHVSYLRRGKLPAKYVAQVQGCMWVCERQWWDFMSYHPDMDPLIIRIDRDEEYIESLAKAVRACLTEIRIQAEMITRRQNP